MAKTTLSLPVPLFDTYTIETNSLVQRIVPENFEHDYSAAREFLLAYCGNAQTFTAYRREIERLLQWSWLIAKRSLLTMDRQGIENFLQFCISPPLSWIASKRESRFITITGKRQANLNWRPFLATVTKSQYEKGVVIDKKKYQLSQKALQAIFSILSSFYGFLIETGRIGHNPVAQIRQKSKFFRQSIKPTVRRLTELQWHYVIDAAKKLATESPKKHERSLFILNALYGMYLRISELVASSRWQPQMGHFFRDQTGNWWFRTVGKGNKERLVTVSNSMLAALKRYRRSLNLVGLPAPGETTPLITKLKGQGPVTSERQIRLIVQCCFDLAVEQLKKDSFIDEAEQLSSATVHWLRHTGISDDVKIRPREHVRDDAGHGSGAITDRYIDVALQERHASGREKQISEEDFS